MKKTLEISAKFDTSDMDRSVDRMQQKLKDLYAPSDMIRAQTLTANRLNQMGIGGMSNPGQQAYQQTSMQSRRELDTYIREQAQGQEKLTKLISKRVEKMNELQNKQKDMVKGSKEELEIKEKISRVEENNYRLREQYKQRDATLNQALDARNKVAPRDIPGLIDAFKFGGAKYGMSQIPGAFRQNPIGMGGALAGGIGAVAAFGGEVAGIAGNVMRRPIDVASMRGSAIQGTLGREIGGIRNNQSVFDLAYMPEKLKAAQMAQSSMKFAPAKDWLSSAGSLIGQTAIGAGGGALAGSAFAGVGAIPGAVVGGIGGFTHALSNKDTYNSLSMSSGAQQYMDAKRAKEFAENFNEGLEGLKNENPLKRMAYEEFSQNGMRNLQLQRGLGINDGQLYGSGGMLQSGANAGFSSDQTFQSAQGILGAGGSSRSAFGNATLGNQMGRMGLTNASQILGTLSGSTGSSDSTRQATIKILAEGMRLGLDDSKFAEENRRFTQAAAEIVSRSGATGSKDFENISGGFGRFVGSNTNAGIEGAKSAYEQYQQISSETSGPRGVMRMAGMLRDLKGPNGEKLDTIAMQGLSNLREDQMTEDNPQIVAAANQLNLSPQDVIEKFKKVNTGAVSRFKEADNVGARIKKSMTDNPQLDFSRQGFKNLPKDIQSDIGRAQNFLGTEYGSLGNEGDYSRVMAFAKGTFNPSGTQGDRESVAQGRLGQVGDRAGDQTMASMAENTKLMLDNFRQFKDQIVPSADAMAKFNAQLKQVVDTISKMPEGQQASMYSKFSGLFGVQQTGGKESK